MSDESSYEDRDRVERATHLDKPLPHPREDDDIDEDDIAVGDDDEGAEE